MSWLIDELKKRYRYVCKRHDCHAMAFSKESRAAVRCPFCGDTMEMADNKLD